MISHEKNRSHPIGNITRQTDMSPIETQSRLNTKTHVLDHRNIMDQQEYEVEIQNQESNRACLPAGQ